MSDWRELREKAWEGNMALHRSGLVRLTFGNLSVIDRRAGLFAIKPSGVPYDRMKIDDMPVLDLDLAVVAGNLRPSSDAKTHAILYRHFARIGSVIHTHSPYAVAWAQALKPIPVYGTTHADLAATDIPCTDVMSDEMIRGDYETETGNLIVRRFADLSPEATPMVLVAGHGPFVWGADGADVVEHAVMLEEIARMATLTRAIDADTPRLKQSLIDRHFRRKHGEEAYYGQGKLNANAQTPNDKT